MKLENFSEASNLVSELGTVEHHIRQVEASATVGNFLGVTLGGTYQSGELLEVVRPVVLAQLNKQRAGILVKLAALGIRQK